MVGLRPNLILMAAIVVVAMFTPASSASAYSVSGTIAFQDYVGNGSIPVTVEFRNVANGEYITSAVSIVDPHGLYSAAGIAPGVYDITYKADRWLRGLIRNVNVNSDVSDVSIGLLNGDASLDDRINAQDYLAIRKAMLSRPGSPGWNANADLNGDRKVDITDYRIAVKNYGGWGEATGACWVLSGTTMLPIVLTPEGKTRLADTATELQGLLRQITGVEPAIKTTSVTGYGIILGTSKDFPKKAAKEHLQDLGPDGYLISSEKDRIWILANTDAGVQNGVYAFLEDDDIGCRWYFPDPAWTIIPSKSALYVDATQRAKPVYDYRRMWYEAPLEVPAAVRNFYDGWMKHNRMYGSFGISCGHAYSDYVPPTLYDTHPEYFALVKDQRQDPDTSGGFWQVCTGNATVQQLMVDGVLKELRKRPAPNMASMEPNDGGAAQFCTCPLCAAQGGTVTDRVFHLANKIAGAVSQNHPGKWVGLLAYSDHATPPSFDLEPNVFVQVTTMYNYSGLTLDQQVSGFHARKAKVGIYDYISGTAWYHDKPGRSTASRVYKFADDIRHYRDIGATTYDTQMSLNWGAAGLGCWMGSRLLWNPDLDPHAMSQDFYNNAFMRAATPMSRIYERWAASKDEEMTVDGLKLALNDLKDAYNAENDPRVRARLDQVAMYLHWLRLGFDYDAAKNGNDNTAIVDTAHYAITYTQRLRDSGLVHTAGLLNPAYITLGDMYSAAKTSLGANWSSSVDSWRSEGESSGVPSSDEAYRAFQQDCNDCRLQ